MNGAAASQPKCRATDPHDWGADAIFRIENRKLVFQSYYKMLGAADPNSRTAWRTTGR